MINADRPDNVQQPGYSTTVISTFREGLESNLSQLAGIREAS